MSRCLRDQSRSLKLRSEFRVHSNWRQDRRRVRLDEWDPSDRCRAEGERSSVAFTCSTYLIYGCVWPQLCSTVFYVDTPFGCRRSVRSVFVITEIPDGAPTTTSFRFLGPEKVPPTSARYSKY